MEAFILAGIAIVVFFIFILALGLFWPTSGHELLMDPERLANKTPRQTEEPTPPPEERPRTPPQP